MGSPSRGGLPESRAVRDGDRFVIDGHKTWVTGGAHLAHLIVQLRLEERAVQVWVPADSAGVRWEETWGEGLSLRASDSHDLYFEGVRVPASRLLTRPSPTRAPSVWFPLMVAANYLGPALAAREAVIRYARERIPTALGRPIATLPGIQRQIGEIDLPLQAAETFLLATAEAWSGDQADREAFLPRAAAAKHLAIENRARGHRPGAAHRGGGRPRPGPAAGALLPRRACGPHAPALGRPGPWSWWGERRSACSADRTRPLPLLCPTAFRDWVRVQPEPA